MAAKKAQDTFEVRMNRLQEIVTALEEGDLPLEEGMRLYKEGLLLSRACREQLDKAKIEVRILAENGTDSPEDTIETAGGKS